MRDTMTGTESRICYERDILELDREHREHPEQRFIFLFADMNNLKSVNGMYGHSAGDEYIAFIGETLRRCLKTAEHIYRMGGDEFLVVMKGAGEREAVACLDRLCEPIPFTTASNQVITFTVSAGYAICDGNFKASMKAADTALYKVKENGRNGFARAEKTE